MENENTTATARPKPTKQELITGLVSLAVTGFVGFAIGRKTA